MQPLTILTSKQIKFKWTDVEQKPFDEVKTMVAHNTLLAYTDCNKQFDIHMDGSEFKL